MAKPTALPDPEVLVPCVRECLKCRTEFNSYDRTKNWLCKKCTKKNDATYLPRTSGSTLIYGDRGAQRVSDE